MARLARPIPSRIPTYDELYALDQADADEDREAPYGECFAAVYNKEYCVTFAVWRNDYGRCFEVGLRKLKGEGPIEDQFQLYQRGFRSCYRRFYRLAKLIEAGIGVSKFIKD